MFYVNRIISFVCLCIGILMLNSCINNKSERKEMTKKESEWLNEVNKTTESKKSGSFLAKDKHENEVVLEWIKTDMLSADYSKAMKSVSDIAIKAYTNIEMQFLKTHPEVVEREAYFKPFEPFFKNGIENIDWKLVEEKMQEHLKSMFLFDTSNLNDEMK